MRALIVDTRPPLRYTGVVKWVRNVAVGIAVLFIVYLVIVSWSSSGGSRTKFSSEDCRGQTVYTCFYLPTSQPSPSN